MLWRRYDIFLRKYMPLGKLKEYVFMQLPQCLKDESCCPLTNPPEKVKLSSLLKGKNVIIVGIPGAFTPKCSKMHIPEYDKLYTEFRKKGIDDIYVTTVNDPYVTSSWLKSMKIKNVKSIPDGNGKFAKDIGMLVKKENLGLGDRSWRYAMVIRNGKVEKIYEEEGKRNNCHTDPLLVSRAGNVLKDLN